MEHKEWNTLLDRYIQGGTMDVNEWEKLDDMQKIIINECKKAFKRIKTHDIQVADNLLEKYKTYE